MRLSSVALVGIGAVAQQALRDPQQAVQRRQVQRAEAALVARVQRDVLVEQALDAGQHHVLVAGVPGSARAPSSNSSGVGAAGRRPLRIGAGQQQRVEQRDQRAAARGR